MARQPLSQLPDWTLVNEQQDVRNENLLDQKGNKIGVVQEMIVDTDAGRVVAIVLGDGRHVPAEDFVVRDGKPVMTTALNQGTAATNANASATTTTPRGQATDQTRTMPLREEELEVQRQSGEVGEVEVGKKVVSEKKTMDVPVSHEEVVVSERDVKPRQAHGDVGEGGDISVPVYGESVDVDKETEVTGEVEIGKRNVQETKRVSDTVRKEVPKVNKHGDVDEQTDERNIPQRDRKAS